MSEVPTGCCLRNAASLLILGLFPSVVVFCSGTSAATYRVAETYEVGESLSWFQVNYCLLSHGQQQYVAYYNEKSEMVVAQRHVRDSHWVHQVLPSRIGWDSHNYITMAVDATDRLHVAGNMHVDPLTYFRTREPGDIATLEPQSMVGRDEQQCTYPVFFSHPEGRLLFLYRSGRSGNGRRFLNVYEPNSQDWSRLVEPPLFDGEGQRNAYPLGPSKGPDGTYHMVWVWRDTSDCATNHHLSYCRSRNLIDWETAAGESLVLPITYEQHQAWVDPIPPGGGIINGCARLAFDSQQRPLVAYHKLDAKNHMQVFIARFEEGGWQIRPVTGWQQHIAFGGRGSMPFIGISISDLRQVGEDRFILGYRHRDYGSGQIVLDRETLRPVDEELAAPASHPRELMKPLLQFEGIGVRIAGDLGTSADSGAKYVLRWESLGKNQDKPRTSPLPPPSKLVVVKLVTDSL